MAKKATKFTEHTNCKKGTLGTLNSYWKGVDKVSLDMAQHNWKNSSSGDEWPPENVCSKHSTEVCTVTLK